MYTRHSTTKTTRTHTIKIDLLRPPHRILIIVVARETDCGRCCTHRSYVAAAPDASRARKISHNGNFYAASARPETDGGRNFNNNIRAEKICRKYKFLPLKLIRARARAHVKTKLICMFVSAAVASPLARQIYKSRPFSPTSDPSRYSRSPRTFHSHTRVFGTSLVLNTCYHRTYD